MIADGLRLLEWRAAVLNILRRDRREKRGSETPARTFVFLHGLLRCMLPVSLDVDFRAITYATYMYIASDAY